MKKLFIFFFGIFLICSENTRAQQSCTTSQDCQGAPCLCPTGNCTKDTTINCAADNDCAGGKCQVTCTNSGKSCGSDADCNLGLCACLNNSGNCQSENLKARPHTKRPLNSKNPI